MSKLDPSQFNDPLEDIDPIMEQAYSQPSQASDLPSFEISSDLPDWSAAQDQGAAEQPAVEQATPAEDDYEDDDFDDDFDDEDELEELPVMEAPAAAQEAPAPQNLEEVSNDMLASYDAPAEASAPVLPEAPSASLESSLEELPNISQIEFPEISEDDLSVEGPGINEQVFSQIPVKISVELGRAELTLKEVYELMEGSIIELERLVGEPLDLLVNDQVIAQGEVVAIDNKYGLRIKSIVATQQRR